MPSDVVCPDCGKVIAPRGTVDDALRCRCGDARGPRVSVAEVPVRPSVSVKVPASAHASPREETEAEAEESNQSTKAKTCYICGTDLTGRIRFKDHLGHYWCKECTQRDKRERRREEELRCADCSRVFPEEKLMYFQTTRVCATCFKEREKELEKKIKKAAAEKIRQTTEWYSIKAMALIAAALLALGTLGYFFSR